MDKKNIILLGISFLLIIFLIGLINSSSHSISACCQQTNAEASCQDVADVANCDDNYRIATSTACESTPFCSAGTCVDRGSGECNPSPQSTCDPTLGGFWYDQPEEDVAECRLGCCITGDGASIVEQVRCETLGSDYGIRSEFRSDITDPLECASLASPDAKGACIFSTTQGRDCSIITRSECQEGEGEFHEGFLCTAPELGTICSITKETTCVEGKNEVYFTDKCGNVANVYDASKVEDIEYWTTIKSPSDSGETCGVGESNKNSATCGNCNYIQGTTCGEGNAQYGNLICQDLSCKTGKIAVGFKDEFGRYPEHGEEWCSDSIGNIGSIEDFENALPGQLSYRVYCYDGEIQDELCDGGWRNSLCLKDATSGGADCVLNNWQICTSLNSVDACNNEDIGDCKVVEGVNALGSDERNNVSFDKDGEAIIARCVPKYPPALEFWDPTVNVLEETTVEAQCQQQSANCQAIYTKAPVQGILGIGGGDSQWFAWETIECVESCFEKCEDRGFWKPFVETKAGCQTECLREKCSRSVCFESGPRGDGDVKLPSQTDLKSSWVSGAVNSCAAAGDCGVKKNFLDKTGDNKWTDLFTGNFTTSSIPSG